MNFLKENDGAPSAGGSYAARIFGILLIVASIAGGVAHYLGVWR